MDNPETQIAFGTRYRTETQKKLKKKQTKQKQKQKQKQNKTKQNKEHNTERIRKFTNSATFREA
jgi:hypothetical protein